MKRSASGTAVVVGMLAVAFAIAAALTARPSAVAPVVLVTIDTLRTDRLGCYGSGKKLTPNLDRLAAEGALFEDAGAAAPLTLPSHATILTGLLPPRHGLRDNDTPRALPAADQRDFLTGPEVFHNAGYATAAFVSGAPLAPRWGLDAGFETYDAPPEGEPGSMSLEKRAGGETVDRAIGWLRSREVRRPFFLWVHLFDPHYPYRAPGGAGLPPDSREAYDEEVAYADAQVGRLVEELRSEGVLDRAVVLACADHGEGLSEHGEATHGFFLFRTTLHVPLILRAPDRVPPGTRVKDRVSLADALPTIMDAARRPLTPGLLDGRSLLPLVRGGGEGAPAPSPQYAETVYPHRSFRWAPGVSMQAGSLHVVDHGGDRREVYDLAADPGEGKDLGPAARPEAAKAAEDAWSLFASPPRVRAPGPIRGAAPELKGVPYITGYSPLVILPLPEYAKLPLPSASFLQRFETALILLERARTEELASEAATEMDQAISHFEELDKDQPANPAPPFWIGRALRQKARLSGSEATKPWIDAFFKFLEAFRRGYKDPRTVSLMEEAAYHAGQYGEMLKVTRQAVEVERMDGDSGFWGWVALSWVQGGRDASGILSTEARAKAHEALDLAKARARSEAELEKIREIEAILK
jgi:arylsulfatase A-like enzyme